MTRIASQPLLSHSIITALPLSSPLVSESWHHRRSELEGSSETNLRHLSQFVKSVRMNLYNAAIVTKDYGLQILIVESCSITNKETESQ